MPNLQELYCTRQELVVTALDPAFLTKQKSGPPCPLAPALMFLVLSISFLISLIISE